MQPGQAQPVALEQVPAKPPPAVAGQGADKPGQKKPGAVGEQLLLEPGRGEVLVADRQGGEGLVLAYPYQAKTLQAQAGQPKNQADHLPYQGMAGSPYQHSLTPAASALKHQADYAILLQNMAT
jgi:hypothetical protein